jgi:hypothetical protein
MATSATWLINMLAKFHEKDPATARGRDFIVSICTESESALATDESRLPPTGDVHSDRESGAVKQTIFLALRKLLASVSPAVANWPQSAAV